jgi:NTP pyrophosphatase (non-canonical NTP hydrolase)
MKDEILKWAKEKGILYQTSKETQMLKTVEEVGELASALAKNNKAEIIDSIGDIAITLMIQAELNGLDFDECIKSAYEVISKRKGKMVNGIFVKEE